MVSLWPCGSGAPVTVRRRVFDAASVAIVQDPSEPFTNDEIDRFANEFTTFIDSTDASDFADEPETMTVARVWERSPARSSQQLSSELRR